MAMTAFTSNFKDKSTDAGFQFVFLCDICGEGYKTEFVESATFKKRGLFKTVTRLISSALYMFGGSRASWGLRRGADSIGGGAVDKSPKWHKEYEAAFEQAQNEAKEHFHRCPKCSEWVCETDWNEQEGLCINDAPRVNVEVAAAKAAKAVDDIEDKAAGTQVFTGEIKSKQTMCPRCGKPAGEGKFCNNCGADLGMTKCATCGAENAVGTSFCGECGTSLA
ncbi:MAG: zinc ribbon domain-containing protein [Longimicrobiales bacterium]